MENQTPIRTFDTGATRNTDQGKLDYEGFLSPVVLKRFAEYMHLHRHLQDGSLRASDNWQKGIPLDALMKSKMRHDQDLWLHHRGYGEFATEDLETSLCGIFFNTQGYLFETLRKKQ